MDEFINNPIAASSTGNDSGWAGVLNNLINAAAVSFIATNAPSSTGVFGGNQPGGNLACPPGFYRQTASGPCIPLPVSSSLTGSSLLPILLIAGGLIVVILLVKK